MGASAIVIPLFLCTSTSFCDSLQTQPVGCLEELELERSVHLQIIEDLKTQLHVQQVDRYPRPILFVVVFPTFS